MDYRGGRQFPESWWRHGDGRWYPPALARHPAAQHGGHWETGDEEVTVVDLRLSVHGAARTPWTVWAVLVGPIALAAGLVAVMLVHLP